jgi:hypothetical protein
MENLERGCVYFFRHIGLSPVKIGYSNNESPLKRFESFKTYAPYGAELLGFIMTKESKELETILHERFSANRLKGEWFEISKEDVEKVVSFYSNIEDIKEKNEFEIEWSKKIANRNLIFSENQIDISEFNKKFNTTNYDGQFKRIVINQGELMEIFNCNRLNITKVLDFFNVVKSSHRVGSTIKKGYLLYEK